MFSPIFVVPIVAGSVGGFVAIVIVVIIVCVIQRRYALIHSTHQ